MSTPAAGLMLAALATAATAAPAFDFGTEAGRAAYLAQARSPADRDFLRRALEGKGYFEPSAIQGPAAATIRTWLDAKAAPCQPPPDLRELSCRLRGIVNGLSLRYVDAPEGKQAWAVLALNYAPDDGNAGRDMLVTWHKGPAGYEGGEWTPQKGADPQSFAWDAGAIRYVAATGMVFAANQDTAPRAAFLIEDPLAAPHVEAAKARHPAAAAGDGPAAPVRALYALPKQATEAMFFGKGKAGLASYYTAAFVRDWTAPTPPGEMGWDGDPLTWHMGDPALRVEGYRVSQATAGSAEVDVDMTLTDQGKAKRETVRYDVVRAGGKWLVDDAHYMGMGMRQMVGPVPGKAGAPPEAGRPPAAAPIAGGYDAKGDTWAGEASAPFAHNGSRVSVFAKAGTIVYYEPKASIAGTVRQGTVIFRGRLGPKGIWGTAFTFKKGCPPAPYQVTGAAYHDGEGFVLAGDPPARDPVSCAVNGTKASGPNATLRFEPAGGFGE